MPGTRVLCVDRDVELLRVLAVVLGRRGHLVNTARSHADALRTARAQPPDILVAPSGRQDDGLDGAALVRSLRGAPGRALLPAIFLTDDLDLAPALGGFNLGSDVRVLRPFQFDTLAEHIDLAVRRISALKETVAERLAAGGAWRGDLAQVGPAAVLDLVSVGAGDLDLRAGPAHARLTVDTHQITAASLEGHQPAAVWRNLAAIQAVLSWPSGQFSFTPGRPAAEPPVVSVAEALAEAAERPAA